MQRHQQVRDRGLDRLGVAHLHCHWRALTLEHIGDVSRQAPARLLLFCLRVEGRIAEPFDEHCALRDRPLHLLHRHRLHLPAELGAALAELAFERCGLALHLTEQLAVLLRWESAPPRGRAVLHTGHWFRATARTTVGPAAPDFSLPLQSCQPSRPTPDPCAAARSADRTIRHRQLCPGQPTRR